MASKNTEQLEKVIQEVFTSEKSYNESVNKCIKEIIVPLQISLRNSELTLENYEFTELFNKYIEIYRVSNGFLDQMNEYIKSGKKISILGVFTSFEKDLVQKYFDYIQTYHHLAPAYRKERESNIELDKFISAKEAELIDSFPSFLILPIQRPPRYRLLLQEIIKFSDPQSTELTGLKDILKTICAAISEVDKSIEEFEEAIRFEELQAKLSDFEVNKISRHILFEGDVVKFSRKFREERHIVMFTDVLLIAEPSIVRPLKVNKVYKSGGYNIEAVEDYTPFINSVDIRQQVKSFRINLETVREKDDFLKAFNKVLEIAKLTHHDMEMKSFAPVWIPDDLAPFCMLCKSKFTFINRRHHCRFCGKCICKKCFKNKIVCPGLGSEEKAVCQQCYEHLIELDPESREYLAKAMLKNEAIQQQQNQKQEQQQQKQQTGANEAPTPISSPVIKPAVNNARANTIIATSANLNIAKTATTTTTNTTQPAKTTTTTTTNTKAPATTGNTATEPQPPKTAPARKKIDEEDDFYGSPVNPFD